MRDYSELKRLVAQGSLPPCVRELIAKNESLRKDAERYRWLRLGMGQAIVVQPDNSVTCDCERFQVLLEEEVDKIADADLAKVNNHV